MTSAPRSMPTPNASGTCRSRTRPAAVNPAPGLSTSTDTSAGSQDTATAATSGWSTSPPAPTHSTGYPGTSAHRAPATDNQPSDGIEKFVSTIAFIGLGIMGSPMAVHLAKAGHQVVGYNRSPERTTALLEAGGTAAESIAKAVAEADVVAVM